MSDKNNELIVIISKFAKSGWDLIDVPAKEWLNSQDEGEEIINKLVSGLKQADEECGSCGCEFDPLYKRAIKLLCA